MFMFTGKWLVVGSFRVFSFHTTRVVLSATSTNYHHYGLGMEHRLYHPLAQQRQGNDTLQPSLSTSSIPTLLTGSQSVNPRPSSGYSPLNSARVLPTKSVTPISPIISHATAAGHSSTLTSSASSKLKAAGGKLYSSRSGTGSYPTNTTSSFSSISSSGSSGAVSTFQPNTESVYSTSSSRNLPLSPGTSSYNINTNNYDPYTMSPSNSNSQPQSAIPQ